MNVRFIMQINDIFIICIPAKPHQLSYHFSNLGEKCMLENEFEEKKIDSRILSKQLVLKMLPKHKIQTHISNVIASFQIYSPKLYHTMKFSLLLSSVL